MRVEYPPLHLTVLKDLDLNAVFKGTEDTLSLYVSNLSASCLDSDLFPRWFRKPGDCVSISSDGWAGMGTT